jgi:hypothetical protein
MAYTLQALIADEAVISAAVPTAAVLVRLPQGKAMIPLSDEMRETHDIPCLPLTDEGAAELPDGITAVAEAIAKAGRVVYVEAEFFGGDGTQACVTWDATLQASQPLVGTSAINTALRFLGVTVGDHHDEFDALGLGRHRATDDWEGMAEPSAPPNSRRAGHLPSSPEVQSPDSQRTSSSGGCG